jgi:BirA family biotin operon repressor/biotin-[acetyl-CoA-carboxylase] ligase
MDRGVSLPFTVLLRFSNSDNFSSTLTLRTGLAVSLAIEDFMPCLQNRVFVKWPNDIIIDSKKTAGILCEADRKNVHLGIGVNIAQKIFPEHLREKATSITLAADMDINSGLRFLLLEKILKRLYHEIENKNWINRLEQRLYKKGEKVIFIEGVKDSGKEVKGRLIGIGNNGEILILPDDEKVPRSFYAGEFV